MDGMDSLLPRIAARGNGFSVGTVADDGRVIAFPILRVPLRQARR